MEVIGRMGEVGGDGPLGTVRVWTATSERARERMRDSRTGRDGVVGWAMAGGGWGVGG